MDDEDWKDLTEQLRANGLHDETALVDVDPSVSREELWRRLRIVALAYQQKLVPKEYRKAAPLESELFDAEREIERLKNDNRDLRYRLAAVMSPLDMTEYNKAEADKNIGYRNDCILRMRKQGRTLKEIADEVGLTPSRVSEIVRKAWRSFERHEAMKMAERDAMRKLYPYDDKPDDARQPRR